MKCFANNRWQHHGRAVCCSMAIGVLGLATVFSTAFFSAGGRVLAQETAEIKGKEIDPIESLTESELQLFNHTRDAELKELDFEKKKLEKEEAEQQLQEVFQDLKEPQKADESPAQFAERRRKKTAEANRLDKEVAKKRGAASMASYKRNIAAQKLKNFERNNPDAKLPDWAKRRIQHEVNPNPDNPEKSKLRNRTDIKDQFDPKTGSAYQDAVEAQRDSGKFDGRRTTPAVDPLKIDRPDRTHDPLPRKTPGSQGPSSRTNRPSVGLSVQRQRDEIASRIKAYKVQLQSYESAVTSFNQDFQTMETEARNWKNDLDALKSDIARFKQDAERHVREKSSVSAEVRAFNADDNSLAAAVRAYNREAASYDREVSHFNSLPGEKQSKFQYDRLNRWKATLRARSRDLQSRLNRLNQRQANLKNRVAYLDSKDREFKSRQRRLIEREDSLESRRKSLVAKEKSIQQRKIELEARKRQLDDRKNQLNADARRFVNRATQLTG